MNEKLQKKKKGKLQQKALIKNKYQQYKRKNEKRKKKKRKIPVKIKMNGT